MTLAPLAFQFFAVMLLAGAMTYGSGRLAPSLGLLDAPNHPRKKHEGTAALTGGLAIFAAWLASLALVPQINLPLVFSACLLVLAGVLDDYHKLGPLKKLAMQAAAITLLVIWGDVTLRHLGHVLPDDEILWLGWFGKPFSILCLLALLNAWNFIDGLDGLAAGVSIVTLGWLATLAFLSGFPVGDILPAIFLIAAVAGFAPVNVGWRKLKTSPVFLGDAGSLFLGLMTGWLAIMVTTSASVPAAQRIPPVLIAWVLAFPVFDLICVAARRMIAGHSPMRADKTHFHHLLCRRGLSPLKATSLIVMMTFAYGLAGFCAWRNGVQENLLFAAWLAAFAAQSLLSVKLTKIRK